MKNNKGNTLLELVTTLLIMSIIVSITLPTFTNSNKNISKKIMYSQFESVFQKASSDAKTTGNEAIIIFGEKTYVLKSQKANKEIDYPKGVSIKIEDVGKEIIFESNGKVKTSVQITFYYDKDNYVFEIASGFQNTKINGLYLNEFKEKVS
ncbi:prepilin-type N-terminal cleavage/methylation domain-containing protein [Bacillus thuringiensis]|uniref:prepilin-type N-terminal cleavage/methylation domain-containing protein n=1 Tax=Bacillus thuringiensis TaxID=1428 RepID=UPI0021D65498|nr:prepilin-type N-terminal cleavage/methylation domain-containing protein [Bacillus thuringiensis]MCU7667084.1 prepilin-type N-terminal cleavage/methylation domain-containing protein [Bacillus thuringiensis]